MTAKEEKYALYTICDDKFIDPTSVMLFSFLSNNKWFNGDIVILYDVLSHKNKVKLKAIYENIIFNSINEKLYESLMNGVKGVTAPSLLKCYYKYELFNEQKYDVIMWVDSDIVFQDSIEELFNDDNVDFCWCEDKSFLGKEIYFNTGFFFFRNIENVKNNSFYNDVFEFTENIKTAYFTNENTQQGLYADQDIFNEKVPLYFKNIKNAPALIYNFPQQVERVDLFKNAKIIHYCGGDKPFSEKINKMFLSHSLWYYYYYQLNK